MEDNIIQQFYDLRKKVIYDTIEFKVEALHHLYHNNRLYLGKPEESTDSYSKIIERMLLGYPIENLNVVIDIANPVVSTFRTNSEQIRALIAFVDNSFKLEKLRYLTEFTGYTFKELPSSIRRKILNYYVKTIVVLGDFSAEYFNLN